MGLQTDFSKLEKQHVVSINRYEELQQQQIDESLPSNGIMLSMPEFLEPSNSGTQNGLLEFLEFVQRLNERIGMINTQIFISIDGGQHFIGVGSNQPLNNRGRRHGIRLQGGPNRNIEQIFTDLQNRGRRDQQREQESQSEVQIQRERNYIRARQMQREEGFQMRRAMERRRERDEQRRLQRARIEHSLRRQEQAMAPFEREQEEARVIRRRLWRRDQRAEFFGTNISSSSSNSDEEEQNEYIQHEREMQREMRRNREIMGQSMQQTEEQEEAEYNQFSRTFDRIRQRTISLQQRIENSQNRNTIPPYISQESRYDQSSLGLSTTQNQLRAQQEMNRNYRLHERNPEQLLNNNSMQHIKDEPEILKENLFKKNRRQMERSEASDELGCWQSFKRGVRRIFRM